MISAMIFASASVGLTTVAQPAVDARPTVGASSPPGEVLKADAAFQSRIADLGSPHWRTRQSATHALMSLDPTAYDALRAAFNRAANYETRRRIRSIVKEIYITSAAGPAPSFLGIGLGPRDARMPDKSMGQVISGVIETTAAEHAGLKVGDVIMAIGGDWIRSEHPPTGLVGWISRQPPGTKARLGVLRGGTGVFLRDELANAAAEDLARIEFDVVRHEDDGRVPAQAAGIRIRRPPEIAIGPGQFLNLEEGDLILAADGDLLPREGTRAAFDQWCRAEPGAKQDAKPRRANGQKPNAPAPKEPAHRTLRVLRGGQWLAIDVVLGRRPASLGPPTVGPAARADTERRKAGAEFPPWWRDTFESSDRSGRSALVAPARRPG